MKKAIAITLALSMTGCATIKRHPMITAVAIGVAVGTTVALTQRLGKCPGEYKSGDPPCPPPDAVHVHK